MIYVQRDRYFPLQVKLPANTSGRVYFTINNSSQNGIPDTCHVISIRSIHHSSGNVCCSVRGPHGWSLGTKRNSTATANLRFDILDVHTGKPLRQLTDTTVSVEISLYQKNQGVAEKIQETAVNIFLASKLPPKTAKVGVDLSENEEMEINEQHTALPEIRCYSVFSPPDTFSRNEFPVDQLLFGVGGMTYY